MAGQRMRPGFHVYGEEEVIANLRLAVAELGLRGREAMLPIARRGQRLIEDFCPVDTGRLKTSYGIGSVPGSKPEDKIGPGGLVPIRAGRWVAGYELGSNVPYAPDVEFGTKFMAAQPHFRPALMMLEAEMRGMLLATMRETMKARAGYSRRAVRGPVRDGAPLLSAQVAA